MPQPQKPPGPAGPPPTLQSSPPDDKASIDTILTRLEAERGRRAIVYWTTALARVSIAAELPLYDQLRACDKQGGLDLVLFTSGGDTEAPWRLVSIIREYCEQFAVLVPHRALSAGTLIALGADEIVITPLGALGPIDPSRTHPLLPRREGAPEPEPISVQDMRHAMQFIREAAGSSAGMPYTPEAMAQIFTALFDKIHPLAIGAIEQSYALAKLIGTRCLETHMDPERDREEITRIVDTLCDNYKSHQYQISRREAKRIGLKVKDASPQLEATLIDLLKFYSARPIGPFGSQVRSGQQVKMHIAWLDSLRLKFRVEQEGVIASNMSVERRGDQWVSY